MLTKVEAAKLRDIASLGRMSSNLYVQLTTAIDEMTEDKGILLIKMNKGYTTAEPIASDDVVAYAAATDAREEISLSTHRAIARELIQRRK